jgi:hypothetical protein
VKTTDLRPGLPNTDLSGCLEELQVSAHDGNVDSREAGNVFFLSLACHTGRRQGRLTARRW